jgi:hypothetical protein
MLQYDGVQTSMITKDCIHGVECDSSQRHGDLHLYIRANPVVTGEDLKTYDHGILNIAQQGVASNLSNQLIGRLFVKYRVLLMKPRFFSGRGYDISKDIFRSYGSPTRDLWLGSLAKGQQNNIGIAVANPSTKVYTFTLPATWSGNLKVMLAQATAGTFTGDPAIALAGNVTYISDIYGTNDSDDDPYPAVIAFEGTQSILIAHLKVAPASGGVNNVVTLTGVTAATNVALTDSYVEFSEYNTGPVTPPIWVQYSNKDVIVP